MDEPAIEDLTERLRSAALWVHLRPNTDARPFSLPELWQQLLSLSAHDPKTTAYISPYVFELVGGNTYDIRAKDVAIVSDAVAILADRRQPLKNRVAVARKLIPWLPALGEDPTDVLSISADVIHDSLSLTNKFPTDLLTLFSDRVIEATAKCHPAFAEGAFRLFLDAPESAERAAHVALLSRFMGFFDEHSSELDSDDGSCADRLRDFLLDCIRSDDPMAQAAATLPIGEFPRLWADDAGDLIDPLLRMHRSDHDLVAVSANKCLRRLLNEGLLLDIASANESLNMFRDNRMHLSDRIRLFTKLIRTFIFSSDRMSDVLNGIVRWTDAHLAAQDLAVRAAALDILANLLMFDQQSFETDQSEKALKAAEEVIRQRVLGPDGPYEFVAHFLVAFCVKCSGHQPKYSERLSALATILLRFILTDPINEPCKLYIAACLARSGFVVSQYISLCLDIPDERLAYKMCPILLSVTGTLPVGEVQKVFQVFTERISASTDDSYVARLTRVLNKFMKDVRTTPSELLAKAIVGGKLASFFDRPLNRVFPILPQLGKYLARHITRSPKFGTGFLEQCSRWLADCYDPVPILRAVRACDVTGFDRVLKRMIEDCDVLDVERLGELARTVLKLPAAEDLIELFAPFVEVLTAPGDDVAAIVHMIEHQVKAVLAEVGKVVFRVYSKLPSAHVRVDMLRTLATIRPRDPKWLKLLMRLLGTNASGLRFECIAGIASHFFTELLLGDDEVTNALRNAMGQSLGYCVGQHEKLKGKLMSQFRLSEQKFCELCQGSSDTRGVQTGP